MGFFDSFKADGLGRKAVNEHSQGNELVNRGKPGEAEKHFDQALILYKQAYDGGCRRPNILLSYAILMMRRGSFTEARELMKVISKESRISEEQHFELRTNYAICLWRLGELDEAIHTLEYAGKYQKNSSYHTLIGTLLVQRAERDGDFETALTALNEALDYDDEDAATLDNFGDYYRIHGEKALEQGDAETAASDESKAREYYMQAHKQKPGQITTLYRLAKYAQKDGDIAKARELTDKAIARSGTRICAVSIEELKELKALLN